MGYLRSFLFAAPLLLALPAHAQQAEEAAPVFTLPPSSAPQPANPRKQGPELDVFRAPATTTAPPPVVAPTVTPTPTPAPTQPTTQAQRPTPTPTPRTAPAPTTPRPAANDERAAPGNESAPVAPPAPEPQPQPQPVPTPSAAAPVEAPLSPAPTDTTPWPWIIGGGLALLALVTAFLLRRRRKPAPDEAETDIAPAEPIPVSPPPKPTPAPTPQPAPEPAPVAAIPDAPDRPWLDMALDLTQARYSLMGMTVGYTLLLHNRGDTPAQDVLVRGIIGNAGAEQQALLQSFFTQQTGLPLHAAVSILPGETRRLTGELRLNPDQIVPVTMGQRSLLIPLAAFDAGYRWGPEEAEPLGHGRTARAFILGQEQEPPAERLAPFRLDQGPRQYRRAATRAAGELVPS
jgi:MYXO-CTERM domain-containing protein